MEKALRIYKKLLEKGQITDIEEKELYFDFKEPEVREILDTMARELNFKIITAPHSVYFVPNIENNLLGFSLKDIRESVKKDANIRDAFLQIYIIMTILYMFYGGKNKDPKQADFLQTKDIVNKLDETLKLTTDEEAEKIEDRYSINFIQIANYWKAKTLIEDNKLKTRTGTVLTACKLLKEEKLIVITDNDTEIRPTKKLDDLMQYHYLNEDRIYEINDIFKVGEENAKNQ
ncbi:MAG: hypothetical protein HFJ52_04435 [Clostridia bacterium]|nr:hypothetical protein [Clostridia bacterium]